VDRRRPEDAVQGKAAPLVEAVAVAFLGVIVRPQSWPELADTYNKKCQFVSEVCLIAFRPSTVSDSGGLTEIQNLMPSMPQLAIPMRKRIRSSLTQDSQQTRRRRLAAFRITRRLASAEF
jgi:hypothetical protein